MTTLDELLSPEPNGRELRLGVEFASGPAWADSDRVMVARGHSSESALSRVSLVRATLQGCIKELQANGEHQAVACIEKILAKTEAKP